MTSLEVLLLRIFSTMKMTEENFIELGKQHGLKLVPDTLKIDNVGLDFVVAQVNDNEKRAWILRVPRREDVYSRAQNENAVLNIVKSMVSVEVPNWNIFEKNLIAYRKIEGTQVVSVEKTEDGVVKPTWNLDANNLPSVFVNSLAKFLVELQRVSPVDAKTNEFKFDLPEPKKVRQQFSNRIEEVQKHIQVHPQRLERWKRWLNDDSFWPSFTSLSHGDLHAAHLLIDNGQSLVGVLDWTEAKFGDPTVDLAMLYRNFGEKFLKDLLLCLEKQGGRVYPKIFEHTLAVDSVFPIAVAEFALASNSSEYMEHAKAELGKEPE